MSRLVYMDQVHSSRMLELGSFAHS